MHLHTLRVKAEKCSEGREDLVFQLLETFSSENCWYVTFEENQRCKNLPITFEDKVRPADHAGGVKASAVASASVDGEGGVFADGVRVVVIVALPGVVVVMEDEVTGEEEDLRANFTALAHPLTVQPDSQVGPWRQDGRVELI